VIVNEYSYLIDFIAKACCQTNANDEETRTIGTPLINLEMKIWKKFILKFD